VRLGAERRAGGARRRRRPEAGPGGSRGAAARSARRRRKILVENLYLGLYFGGLVIVEGIDDLEVVVMKIGEEVMDFEDKC